MPITVQFFNPKKENKTFPSFKMFLYMMFLYKRHILLDSLIHDTIYCFSFSFFVLNKIPRSLPHLPMGYSHFPVKPTQQDVRLCGLVCKLRGIESFPASLSH